MSGNGLGGVGLSKIWFCRSFKMTNPFADLWELFELSLNEGATWSLGVGCSVDLLMEVIKRNFLFPRYELCLCKLSACYMIREYAILNEAKKISFLIWWHTFGDVLPFLFLWPFWVPHCVCLVQRAGMSTGCSSWWSSISPFQTPAHSPPECELVKPWQAWKGVGCLCCGGDSS